MNFLDESGLKKLWTKIKSSFGTAIVMNSSYSNDRDNRGRINIPFVANHQIIIMDKVSDINIFNWYIDAPIGGILEIASCGAQGDTFCTYNNEHFMIKIESSRLTLTSVLRTKYNTYARLVKTNEKSLLVAEFVENKSNQN